MKTIFRYEVPDDGAWHDVDMAGEPLHVACRRPSIVEFWAEHRDGPSVTRRLRVFGTGHQVPDQARYRGTALAGPLVLHLYEEGPPG